jgi:hypothetical protein
MRVLVTMALGFLLAMTPAWSQERRSPIMASGEIRIPTKRELEREVFATPRDDFSSIDTVADGEMNRMDRQIDRLVDRGICDGC